MYPLFSIGYSLLAAAYGLGMLGAAVLVVAYLTH